MEFNFFEAIVAGDNHKEIMKQYDNKIQVEPYVVYSKADAEFLKAQYINSYNVVLDSNALDEDDRAKAMEIIHDALSIPAEAFFEDFTYDFDHDAEGNAISTANPKGKWRIYQTGRLFSIPFMTLDGREVFQAKKGEIDWDVMHLHGQEIYKRAWEMVMEGSKPKNDYENQIFENMKNRQAYFNNFKNKEEYVTHSTAFWAYAFVTEKEWVGLEEGKPQYDWVANFYERFIEPLPDDTILTILECKK